MGYRFRCDRCDQPVDVGECVCDDCVRECLAPFVDDS